MVIINAIFAACTVGCVLYAVYSFNLTNENRKLKIENLELHDELKRRN